MWTHFHNHSPAAAISSKCDWKEPPTNASLTVVWVTLLKTCLYDEAEDERLKWFMFLLASNALVVVCQQWRGHKADKDINKALLFALFIIAQNTDKPYVLSFSRADLWHESFSGQIMLQLRDYVYTLHWMYTAVQLYESPKANVHWPLTKIRLLKEVYRAFSKGQTF